MEDAYKELYEQFLNLKSLCLKQAALLHELSTALQKYQGATVPNGALSDVIPAFLEDRPHLQAATAQNPAEHSGIDCFSKNTGAFSDLLAEDISKLSVEWPFQKKENWDQAQPLLSRDSCMLQVSKHLLQTDRLGEDVPTRAMRTPAEGRTPLAGHCPGQCEGLLLSDVALQSHVCEFCQAVFPGDTTTRGEFLRHLYTHVT
ncbi:uncharacterized protein zgc:113184 [Brachionichthys hirsutus]|uniref:uncharacterized protein zgc:113184 n=1 Tax=Brachionichthys hirsutus TaxID=412623 RepID=UPI003604AAC9